MPASPNRDELIVYLAALGRTNAEIADTIGVTPHTVGQKLQDPRVAFEVKSMRYKLYGKDHKKRFQEILPHAIDTVERVMMDPTAKAATKLAAAQDCIDRALGKPKQTVEHEGSLVRALIEQLEGKKRVHPEPGGGEIDVTPRSLPLPEYTAPNPNESVPTVPKDNPNFALDPIDQWVDNNL